MKSFRDYLGLSNSCSYDVIGRADRFGFQNFCSPAPGYLDPRPGYLDPKAAKYPLSGILPADTLIGVY